MSDTFRSDPFALNEDIAPVETEAKPSDLIVSQAFSTRLLSGSMQTKEEFRCL